MTGEIIWVTGFPGSGKTTFSKKLIDAFNKKNIRPILLDGDELREILSNPSMNSEDRKKLSYIYADLAINLSRQGFVVIVATVSMFEAVREKLKNSAQTKIVFLEPPLSHLTRINKKELYSDVSSLSDAYGKIYPGYELPREPEQHITDIECYQSIAEKLVESYE